MSSYPHLWSELRIGTCTVRNRLVQTAHLKLFSRDGTDSDRDLAYYVERARGGVGLMITGARNVHPTSVFGPGMASSFLRAGVAVDRRLTSAVHEHGAAIFAQLNHVGLHAYPESEDGYGVAWGPSAVKSHLHGTTPKAMEPEDLREVVEWWARSAEHSREAGFDGAEIHMTHGYLLSQFLSPIYNRRTDDYGGSFENRLRLAREVIDAVRRRVGRDWTVGVRLSLTDFFPGGLEVEDAVEVAVALEHDGAIDYVNVSAGGLHEGYSQSIPTADIADGWLLERVARVKAALTRLPVFAVGGLSDPDRAEAIVAGGQADMVAMTRALIADPELPTKLREGRANEVYHCIRGNQGCIRRISKELPMACTVNPAAGRERRFGAGTLERARRPGRWLVVGGGPAGLKAAETLAKRGHSVTLVEREERLGGQVRLIVKLPGRESFGWIVRDLETQLRLAAVDVRLGTEATSELVAELQPAGVVVATGSRAARSGFANVNPFVERLPGADQENVVTGWDVLLGAPVGERVLVVDDDGSRYVAGVVELLLDRGRSVELVSRFTQLFPGTALSFDMPLLYRRILRKGLRYRLNSWVRGIAGDVVTVYDLYTDEQEPRAGVDTVVLVTGHEADDDLYFALKGSVPTLWRVGDCLAPRSLDHAVYEGYLAGRELWPAHAHAAAFAEAADA